MMSKLELVYFTDFSEKGVMVERNNWTVVLTNGVDYRGLEKRLKSQLKTKNRNFPPTQ